MLALLRVTAAALAIVMLSLAWRRAAAQLVVNGRLPLGFALELSATYHVVCSLQELTLTRYAADEALLLRMPLLLSCGVDHSAYI
jgi:hypothetical protein